MIVEGESGPEIRDQTLMYRDLICIWDWNRNGKPESSHGDRRL